MASKGATAFGILGVLALITGVVVAATKQSSATPSGKGGAFTVGAKNLPAGATGWGCAVQDPVTGTWYQPTNHAATGSFLFVPNGVAEMTVPLAEGILSISAFSGASLSEISQMVNYQVPIGIINGGHYVFDFALGQLG